MFQDNGVATKNALEYLRPVGYIYYLSSPASAALQMASIPTFVWPKLGSKYGFVKSAKALAKTIKLTIKIVNAAVKHGMQAGVFRGLDIFFDADSLKKAGIDPATAEFIIKVSNSSAIEFGSMARELGRLAASKQDTPFDRALAMAGFMNNYTETVSRIWTALAVNELAPSGSDKVKLTKDVIGETIFDFGLDNEPRAFGRGGILREYTPVALQFTKINWFMLEEIYRSARDAFFSTGLTKAQQQEARRFLAGHITSVAALTGTLGLPFAASVATAINALADVLGDDEEPYDVQAAWRNWLAGAFGKDVGEVIARGVPRAFGVDISARAGEAYLIPFSKFMEDNRKFEDKFKDFITDMAGAPIGAVSSMAIGLSQIANGDVLPGMQQFLPAALRTPLQAYTLGSKGYTDKSGNVIPIDPDALDILYQAVGFKPSEKAEYDEARMVQLRRESLLSRKSGDLRRKLATAIEDGDTAEQKKLFEQAREFDLSNPAYAVVPTLESAIMQRARAREMMRATGLSFGTNMRDIGSIEAQGFANIGR
jgi:hypothetical protein